MVITLLQSLFLLGLAEQRRGKPLRAWLLITIPLFAVFLFRTPLVPQSSAALIGSLLLAFFFRRGKRMISAQIVGWMVVAGMLVIGSDSDLMMSIGIYAEHRLLTSEGMGGVVFRVGSKAEMSPIVFPALYFFSDTRALVLKTWATLGPDWLHGLLVLPWILSSYAIFLSRHGLGYAYPARGFLSRRFRWRDSRLVATP